MTEPNDPAALPSSPPAPPTRQDPTAASSPQGEPAEAGIPAPDVPEPPVPEPPVQQAPVWIPPDGGGDSGRRRGCCLILAVVGGIVAVLAVIAIAGLIFLGSQVQALLGTVKFEAGTASTDCFVKEPATTFPASASIHFVARFKRAVTADEKITVVVTFPDGTSRTTDEAYEGGGICVSDTLNPGLDTGPWALEFRTGSEVLASGGFTVTP